MASFYGDSQWQPATGSGYDAQMGPGGAQSWEPQMPPNRSGASSTIPREEPGAFHYQFMQVDKARDELLKSGKMPGMGMTPNHGMARQPRLSGGPAGRSHSPAFAGRGGPGHPPSNLQNFYATQRSQPSRGPDADQMQQHKRRLAAQRERELRNYHQEQQYNRTSAYPPGQQEVQQQPGPVNARPDRTFTPGGTAEVPHHELIARQHNALQGKGPFGEGAGYIDENGMPRQGMPIQHMGGNNASAPVTGMLGGYNYPTQEQLTSGPAQQAEQQPQRGSSNASPQSNPSANVKAAGPLALEQVNRTSNSSPGSASASHNGRGPAPQQVGGVNTKTAVAPIGTRPAVSQQGGPKPSTPLGYSTDATSTMGAPTPSTTSATTEGSGTLSGVGNWGQRSAGPWGSSKTQTSVWG